MARLLHGRGGDCGARGNVPWQGGCAPGACRAAPARGADDRPAAQALQGCIHPNPAKNLKPVGALAVDVWTTNGGIAYDNFYLGGSEAEAKESAASYYAKKAEEEQKAAEKKAAKAAKRAAKGKGWRGLLLKAKKFGQAALDRALDQPLAAGGTLLVLIITLLMTRKKKAVVEEDEAEEDEDEEEEESEEEEEEPAPRRGRRRTPKAD